ncbi:Replication protein C, partial [uncultured Caudovirales phage]
MYVPGCAKETLKQLHPYMTGYELVKKLIRTRKKCVLTATEQALYHELVNICNEDEWTDIFTASNDELSNALNITEKTLIGARVSLIQAGLIYYRSGKSKRKYGEYSFTVNITVKVTANPTANPTANKGANPTANASDYNKTKTETFHPPASATALRSLEEWITLYFDTPTYAKARESVAMAYRLSIDVLRTYAERFNIEQTQAAVEVKQDWPLHFRNWLRLTLEREQQNTTHATTGNTKQ